MSDNQDTTLDVDDAINGLFNESFDRIFGVGPASTIRRLQMRTKRAEEAAAGSMKQTMALMRTIDALFKAAGDAEAWPTAVDDLRKAHDEVVAWAKAEAAKVHQRVSS